MNNSVPKQLIISMWSLHVRCLRGIPPGAPLSSHSPQTGSWARMHISHGPYVQIRMFVGGLIEWVHGCRCEWKDPSPCGNYKYGIKWLSDERSEHRFQFSCICISMRTGLSRLCAPSQLLAGWSDSFRKPLPPHLSNPRWVVSVSDLACLRAPKLYPPKKSKTLLVANCGCCVHYTP